MKKQVYVFGVVFLFICGVFSLNAQDLIVLRDGNIIEAKVEEISTSEIRYKRFDHLDGPNIVVPVINVLSIRYENGRVEIFNAVLAQTNFDGNTTPQLNQPTVLQSILNALPAIRIAGNNLKFEFGGESWVAKVNGENFSTGIIEFEETAEGGTLTLRQTHIWPGAVGRTAGRVANVVPGGGAVGGVLTAAGNVAGALGPIETSGTIVLEYKSGPPASLRLVSSSGISPADMPETKTANARNNWLSVDASFIGGGLRYERILNESFSWGLIGFGNYFSGIDESFSLGLLATSRFYPGGSIFYLELGMGLGRISPEFPFGGGYGVGTYYVAYEIISREKISESSLVSTSGFMIQPSIGVKIGGYRSSFFINPFFSIPMGFGTIDTTETFLVKGYEDYDGYREWYEWREDKLSSRSKFVTQIKFGVSIGFAW